LFLWKWVKAKKCHNDIHESSKAARLLRTFNIIDLKIQEHYKNTGYEPPCKPGCANCCSDYFAISDIEYGMIIYSIQKWNSKQKEEVLLKAIKNADTFMKAYPEIFNYFEQDSTGDKDKLKALKNIPDGMRMPCVFLDENTKQCKIYNVRPLICRLFGVSFSFDFSGSKVCNVIGSERDARAWQADLRDLVEEQYKFDYIRIDGKTATMIKCYPIFYLIYYNHKVNKDFQIGMSNENFKQPEQLLINMFRQYYLRNKML